MCVGVVTKGGRMMRKEETKYLEVTRKRGKQSEPSTKRCWTSLSYKSAVGYDLRVAKRLQCREMTIKDKDDTARGKRVARGVLPGGKSGEFWLGKVLGLSGNLGGWREVSAILSLRGVKLLSRSKKLLSSRG